MFKVIVIKSNSFIIEMNARIIKGQ